MWFDDWFADFFGSGPEFREVRAAKAPKASVQPGDFRNLLDWGEDPIGRQSRQPHHLVYARMIPFLAASAQRVSGGKTQGKKIRLDRYLPLAKETLADAGLQTTYLRSFVSQSMKLAGPYRADQLFSLAEAAGTFLRQFADEEEMRDVAGLARQLAWGITSEGEALLSHFLGYRYQHRESERESFHMGGSHSVPIHHGTEKDPEEEDLALLGLKPGASDAEIRHAWHDMVKRNHPDANKGNEEAAEKRLIAIGEAYQRLRSRRGF
ncbi:MAG: J domain-containing protein [Sphaerochaetaceae bacterium]|nr:J domain-containing protein [Spirochaetales bacterium]MDY5500765.1 J domain-containing protein [Sphaerochaetaceae bacterium]